MEARQRPRRVARYAEKVIKSLRTKGGRCQGPSNGERSRVDGATLTVAVRRRKVGRANAGRGARIDGTRAGGDEKVGVLCVVICVGNPRDQERKQGHFEPLVTVGARIAPRPNREVLVRAGLFLLRRFDASCPDEQRETEKQHECSIEALHPLQRHTVQVGRFLDGLARGVLARVRLVVRERVLDVGVPEELLE